MKIVIYKTHWSYLGAGIKRKAPLSEFVLDILYLMDIDGVIPPFHILNEVLQRGGNSGGMGPGTSWKPFSLTESEYDELLKALLTLDINEARKNHPYIAFDSVKTDESLHDIPTYLEWLRAKTVKYRKHE